jgi:hypothetical protein
MAKIYLGTNDNNYNIVNNNNTTIFGTTGTQSIVIASGLSGVTMDSSVEGATFAGNLADYTFKQVGVSMEVYRDGVHVTTFQSPNQTPTFKDGARDIGYTGGKMSIGDTQLVDGSDPISATVDGTATATDTIALTSNTTAVDGVAEEFTYAINSTTTSVVSSLLSEITLSGFKVGEDSLTFIDSGSWVTTQTFTSKVIISASSINNQTDIIFDANSSGNAYQLTLAGVVDDSLSTLDMIVT